MADDNYFICLNAGKDNGNKTKTSRFKLRKTGTVVTSNGRVAPVNL